MTTPTDDSNTASSTTPPIEDDLDQLFIDSGFSDSVPSMMDDSSDDNDLEPKSRIPTWLKWALASCSIVLVYLWFTVDALPAIGTFLFSLPMLIFYLVVALLAQLVWIWWLDWKKLFWSLMVVYSAAGVIGLVTLSYFNSESELVEEAATASVPMPVPEPTKAKVPDSPPPPPPPEPVEEVADEDPEPEEVEVAIAPQVVASTQVVAPSKKAIPAPGSIQVVFAPSPSVPVSPVQEVGDQVLPVSDVSSSFGMALSTEALRQFEQERATGNSTFGMSVSPEALQIYSQLEGTTGSGTFGNAPSVETLRRLNNNGN